MMCHPWYLRALLTGLTLVTWPGHPLAAGPPAHEPTAVHSGERSLIRVEGELVSVDIEEATLDEVLRQISLRTTRVVLHGSRSEKISANFQSVPLVEALRRLIQQNFLLLQSTGSRGSLVEVWILGLGTSPAVALGVDPEPFPSGDDASVESLLLGLQEKDPERRWKTVRALSESTDERALEALIGVLTGDDSAHVRQGVISALEDLGGMSAITALVQAVAGDEDQSVRQSAVAALAKIGGEEAIPPLTRALTEDPDPFVRYEALLSLARIGGERARGPLLLALHDPEQLVSVEAEEILESQIPESSAQ